MSNKPLVLIVGTGRAGSSAITRTLSFCGGSLPSGIMGAHDEINPTGFWEPRDSVNLNLDFLSRHGSSDPTVFPEEVEIGREDRNAFVSAIREFLSECRVDMALIIKDPCITQLMEFWLEAAAQELFLPRIVIAMRNPEEVIPSWNKSMAYIGGSTHRQPPRESLMNFWLKLNLMAERSSRNFPRVFVEYRNLLQDWRTEVRRMSDALAIDFEVSGTEVDNFLRADLYRQQHIGAITDIFSQLWITQVYETFSAAAQDGLLDIALLDRIYDDYRRDARAFRTILKEPQSRSTDEPQKTVFEFLRNVPTWQPK